MKLWSDTFSDGQNIPDRCALGRHHPEKHIVRSGNRNPHVGWGEMPIATQSLVLIAHDPDCPSAPDDVNQSGREVPASLLRIDFFHWVLVDLAPGSDPISEGEFTNGVTPKGKPGPDGPRSTRSGLNDYTGWFKGDPAMEGQYFGYDGPCPPWNDSIIHRYHFTMYALDVTRCPVEGTFTGHDVRKAIQGHVLEQATITATYTINPRAIPK